MSSIVVPWAVEVGIIAARDLASDEHRPPLPSELLSSFVVFGALAGVGIAAPKVATYTGWGLVLATLLATKVDFLSPVGDFLAGKSPAKSGGPAGFGIGTKKPKPKPTGQVAGNLPTAGS